MTDVKPILTALETLNHNQLSGVIERAHELIEQRQTERRKVEIAAELNDLFAELTSLDIDYYFGTPARNGGMDCYVILGDVTIDDEDGAVIIK